MTQVNKLLLLDERNITSSLGAVSLYLNGEFIAQADHYDNVDLNIKSIAENTAKALGNAPVEHFELTGKMLADWMKADSLNPNGISVFAGVAEWDGHYTPENAYKAYLMASGQQQ